MAGERQPLIAGNWKMNLTHHEASTYLAAFHGQLATHDTSATDIALLPSFTALHAVQALLRQNNVPIAYGAQDLSPFPHGAYTGDISGPMLSTLECTYVLVGHSERRQYHDETDSIVRAKIQAAFKHGLAPILCVGEGLDIRRKGVHIDFTLAQVRAALGEVREQDVRFAVIAYEPVWAIGTGEVATPADAQEVCAAIREQLSELFTRDLSQTVRVLYGGSVTVANIADIMAGPDIDGALVGGASLDPVHFAAICHATAQSRG
jgi:triosephosphate isomerase